MSRYGYSIYELDIPDLIFQIQVALYRFEQGFVIPMEEVDQNSFLQEKDIMTAQAWKYLVFCPGLLWTCSAPAMDIRNDMAGVCESGCLFE